jgi:hypothetical protein
MKQLSDQNRRIGGLFLEALVLIFVFSSSFLQSGFVDRNLRNQLVIKTSPVEQIAFRDPDLSSKSLLDFILKVQISNCDLIPHLVELPPLDIEGATFFAVNPSLYNTFYVYLSANAP